MRKLLALFLLLCVFLTACDRGPTPSATEERPGSAETAPPQSTEPPVTQPDYSGSTTAGGVRVQTDWSGYRPYVPQEAVCTRLREEPLLEFEPSEDYGTVLPYVAGKLYSNGGGGNGEVYREGALFGLMDRGGRILTDGVYTSIQPLQTVHYKGDMPVTVSYPFWRLRRVENGVKYVEVSEESGFTWTWAEGDVLYGVVSMDGRFALPCEYLAIRPTDAGLLCYRSWDGPDFEFYGLDGRLRFTGKDFFSDGTTDWSFDYSEGLFCIGGGDDDSREYWFCGEDGKRVLGPYRSASCFHGGLACVSTDGEHYGYIDQTGTWVIDPLYTDSYAEFSEGTVVQHTPEGSVVALDRSGRRLLEFADTANKYINPAPCGFLVEDWDSNWQGFYDRNGELLMERDGWGWSSMDEDTFAYVQDDSCRIFRLNGEELRLENVSYVNQSRILLDGALRDGYIAGFYDVRDGEQIYTRVFVSRDLKETRNLGTFEYDADGYVYSREVNFDLLDEVSGETWYFERVGGSWTGMTESGLRCSLPELPTRAFDGCFLLDDDSACVIVNENGETIFRLPLNAED